MRKLILLLVFVLPIGVRAQLTYPTVKTQNCPTAGKTCQIPTNNGNIAYNITLTGDVLYPITDIGSNGAEMYLNICQDATGNHAWVWPSGFTNPPTILASGTSCSPVTFVNKGGGIWLNEGIGNGLGSGGGGGGSLFGSTDPVGVCINGTLYTNTTTPSFWICQSGTWVKNTASPGGSSFQAQFNNAGAFGGSSCFNLAAFPNGPANLDCDTYSIGPNPVADITRWGARFVPVGAQPTATGVVCTSGSPNVTATTVSGTFLVGDYVMGVNCGPAITVTTPSPPSVVSGSSAMQTVPDAIINAVTGASTYNYKLVTKDSNGGLTAPSTATTITTGVTLGQQTATVSSVTSVGTTMTITLGSNGPPNGTLIHLSYIAQGVNQPNHKFDGYYNISSGGGSTSIVINNLPFYSNTTDATAAEIVWFNGNKLTWTNQSGAWTQYICGERPGDVSYHFLGSAIPASGAGSPFTSWVDWGNTVTPASPTGFPEGSDSICSAGSATNDYLDNVKIVSCSPSSCASGSTWTLSGNAGSNSPGGGVTFVQDSAPALTAANNNYVNAGVAITIPCTATTAGGPVMNFQSPQTLTSIRNWIDQCGNLNINETIDIGNVSATYGLPWIGRTQFQLNSNSQNIFYNAYPALNNVGVLNNIAFNASGSASSLGVIYNTGQISNGNQTPMFDHDQFIASGHSSMGVVAIGIFPFGYITNTKEQLGPTNAPSNYDATWTPWLYLSGGAALHLLNSYGFGRGIYVNVTGTAGPTQLDVEQNYVQGSIMPTFGIYAGPSTSTYFNARQWVSDTSPQPMISIQTNPSSLFSVVKVRYRDLAGLPVNNLTGWAPTSLWDEGTSNDPTFLQPSGVFPDSNTNFGKLSLQTGTVSDGFNRANGSLGSNWVNQLNTCSITSNQVSCSGGGWNESYYQGTTLLPNSYPNPNTGGEFCQVTVQNYGSQQAGCGVYIGPNNGYVCTATGTTLSITVPNHFVITGPTSYSNGGPGDQLFETALETKGSATQISCTVFPVNGTPVTITGTDSGLPTGFPGIALFGTGAVEDAFGGGTINPQVIPTVENYFNQPIHASALTVGQAAPIPGSLPYGFFSVNTALIGNYIDFVQQPSSPSFGNPSAGNCRGFFAFGGNMSFINSTGASCGPSGGGSMVFPNTVGLVRWTGGAAWAPSVNDTTALTGQPLVATNGAASGFSSPGIQDGNGAAHVTTTPYVVLCDSATIIRDRGTTIVFDSGASVVTLPDHTASGCGNNNAFVLINNSGGALTVNRGGADTLDIYGIGTNPTIAATSFTLQSNAWAALNNGESTRWNVRMGGGLELTKVTTTTGTGAISGNSCTAATTVTMTGLTSTQTLVFTPNADISGITGWGSTGGLVIEDWPSANTVNYRVCNQTGSSITPGGSVTWNVSAQ